MSETKRVAAMAGWYTLDPQRPHLLGSRCSACGTCFFPRVGGFCRNPGCEGSQFEEVKLSRTGRIWSYTNACYRPPEPFVSPEPFEPFAIAAVELDTERMIILGQVAAGVGVEQLKIGMRVEVVLELLHVQDGVEKLVWKWRPIEVTGNGVMGEVAG